MSNVVDISMFNTDNLKLTLLTPLSFSLPKYKTFSFVS